MKDVLFYDAVGMPYTGVTLCTAGLGGTEQNVVLLAEALAKEGLSVVVATKTTERSQFRGVEYVPLAHAPDAKTLVHMRYGILPSVLNYERRVLFSTDSVDISVGTYDKYHASFRHDTHLVTVAQWQLELFKQRGLTGWKSETVIPGILPTSVTERRMKPSKYPHRFVYASAARKGLRETLQAWSSLELPKDAELVVTNPGYDAYEAARIFREWGTFGLGVLKQVTYLGVLPSMDDVADLIADSAGLFFVNTFAECTSITLAMCEALNRRVHLLCKNGFGGVRETIRSPLVTNDEGKFRRDFLAAFNDPSNEWYGTPFDFSAEAAVRAWLPLVKPVYRQPGERVPPELVSPADLVKTDRDVSAIYDAESAVGVEHFWRDLPGYFTFSDFYEWLAKEAWEKEWTRGVEVGAYYGQSAVFLAVELQRRGSSCKIDLVDIFQGTNTVEEVERLVAPVRWRTIDTIRRECSWEAAGHYADGSLDFVFIDAAHDYESVRKDIDAWLPKVKVGGILAGHDFTDEFPGVARAVMENFNEGDFQIWFGDSTFCTAEEMRGKSYPVWSVRVDETTTGRKRTVGSTDASRGSNLYNASWSADRVAEGPGYIILADAIHESFAFNTVVDIGCGPGMILARLHDLGHRVEGFDGSEAARAAAPERIRPFVKPINLEQQIILSPTATKYDLVICTEVGEHLDEHFADTLVSSLTNVAGKTILFSAATPGSLGPEHGHVNEKPHSYWIMKFAVRGWDLTPKTSSIRDRIREPLRTTNVPVAAPGTLLDWAPKNLLVFERRAKQALANLDVAVVIPCFNQAEFLEDAIESVWAQTRLPHEIIVVAGDDESYSVAQTIAQKNKTVNFRITLDGGKGLANARNVGINTTSCPLIFPLDADDTIEPKCLEKMVILASDDRTIVASWMQKFGSSSGQLRVTQNMLENGYTSPMCLFTRKLWELVGGYDVASPIEDWAFWLDCHKHDPTLRLIEEPLVYRRMHGKQATKTDPYAFFMSVDRFLRPDKFPRTYEDERNVKSEEIQAWVAKRLEHFPDNKSLKMLQEARLVRETRPSMVEEGAGLGLCMIVKNESKVIERCLRSVMPLLTHWTVVDTGSTDGTQDIIRKVLKDIPGELHDRPWVDFAFNRNEAIKFATGKTSYLLVIDADDEMEFDEGFHLPVLSADAYRLKVQHGDKVHYRPHIFRPEKFRYEGVRHEYLEGPIGDTRLVGLTMQIVGGGSRNRVKNKFVGDAHALKKALEKDPTSTRYTFYLARSWYDAFVVSENVDYLARALKVFTKRAKMGGFEEEIFTSLLEVAKIHERLGHDRQVITKAYLDAYAYRPSRAEPLFWLARWLRMKHSDHASAAIYARQAAALPKPVNEVLWIESTIYDWWALDEFSVAASWIPALREEGRVACLKLLACAPDREHERIRATLKCCGG